jgi:uncharacterized protein HemY
VLSDLLSEKQKEHDVSTVRNEARRLLSLGEGLLKNDQTSTQAEDYFSRAYRLFDSINDSTGKGDTFKQIAAVYMARKQDRTAEKCFKKAIDFYARENSWESVASVYADLAKLYEETGETDKATASRTESERFSKKARSEHRKNG